MDFKANQTNSTPANGSSQPATSRFGGGGAHAGNSKKLILIAVIVLVIIIAGLLCLWGYKKMKSGGDMAIKSEQYQALFMTNGQVYFGKLSNVNHDYVKLTDIYYLQVQQAVQPPDNKAKDQQQPQVSLAKLGNELHGPEDSMWVNRDQVLFWENLKNDGKVVKAIQENQKK